MSTNRFSKMAFALSVALVAASCASNSTAPAPASSTPSGPTSTEATSSEAPAPPPTSVAPAPTTIAPSTSAAARPADQLAPGDHTISVRHDGRDRSYIVHVPATLPAPTPVMIALHGGGGTGAQFQDDNGLDAVADREGFLAVYPEGSGLLPNRLHTWNGGFNCCGWAHDNDIDDVGFLRAVIADLSNRFNTDPGRVYMTGHSNGGIMAYRFAAEAADLVTAIVPVGGAMAVADLNPAQPVAVLHIHSLDDPRALYQGGLGPPFPGTQRGVEHEPVLAGIEAWAAANGCELEARVAETVVGTGADEGQSMDQLRWDGCATGGDVEHLRLAGSGHGWPGVSVSRVLQGILGPPTTLVDASEQAWAYASRFSR